MKNLLVAPDSFKGCLSSSEVCSAIAMGAKAVDEEINVMQFPSSDGGEGFCFCMKNIFGGDIIETKVTYPLGNRGKAEFVFNRDSSTAYLELASASGLSLVDKEKRNIMRSSTYGFGELIREAVSLGAKTIIMGLGGSATNDCGIGLLSALGIKFYNQAGNELKAIPSSLSEIEFVDKNQMIDLSAVKLIAACDVKNPLCGENGAAKVFAKQKGANESEIEWLDNASKTFASAVGINPFQSGFGAAGGVGFALMGFLNAEYVSGARLLTESQAFTEALSKADLVITGEGNTDRQTSFGKLPAIVSQKAKSHGVPCVLISGGVSEGFEEMYNCGVVKCYSLSKNDADKQYCIDNAFELLKNITYRAILEFYM